MASTTLRYMGPEPEPNVHTRREVLRSGAGLLALLGLAGCGPSLAAPVTSPTSRPSPSPAASATSGPTEELPPVKIGYLPILDATPLLVAHAQGFFAEEGLNAEPPTLVRSWSQLSEAFMAGSVNLVHLLFPIPIYMRYGLGFPAKVVAWNHMNGSALTVSQKAGIQGLEDLGGKQIAVPFWYSQHNVVLQKSLRAVGLEPVIQDRTAQLGPRQVNLFVMNPPDMPTALQAGSIDGYTVAEPFNAAGELLAGGKILRFNGDIWRNHPCCVAVLHEESVVKRPEWSQGVVNALVKAQRWAGERKGEAASLLSKEGKGYLPTAESVVTRAMTKYDLDTYGIGGTGAIRHSDWKSARISFQPYPYPSATELLTTLLKETQLEGDTRFIQDLDPKRVAADLVDYRLVGQAIDKAGGISRFEGVGGTTTRTEEFAVT
jgi:NitT/TauT family transport system substrate-binding protein